MRKYTVQDPSTGKIITFEGEKFPSDSELDKLFADARAFKTTPENKIVGNMGDKTSRVAQFLQLGMPSMERTPGAMDPTEPLIRNAGREATDLWGMVRHPIQTLGGLSDLTRGAVDAGVRRITPGSWNTPEPSQREVAATEYGKQLVPKLERFAKYPISSTLETAVNNPISTTLTLLGATGNLPRLTPKVKTAEGYLGKAVEDFSSVIPTKKTLARPAVTKDAEIMFRDLAENKHKLILEDFGEEVTGKLPGQLGKKRAMEDFLTVFQQGKANLWQEISKKLKEATGKGGAISDENVARAMQTELDKLGRGVQRGNSAFYDSLDKRIKFFQDEKKIWTPEEAQSWAAELNAKVKDIKPGSIDTNNTVRQAAIEARAVKDELDNVVMSLSDDGAGVSELKRKYAAYKTFEKDIRDKLGKARFQEGHVNDLDLYDVYSGSLVTGALTGGNMSGIPKAIVVQLAKRLGKSEANINHIITRAFKNVEEATKYMGKRQ